MYKKQGRPPQEVDKRSKKIDVRLTQQELMLVNTLAKASGIGRGEFIRKRLLAAGDQLLMDSRLMMGELDRLGLELSRSGNNINQLARYANILNRDGLLSPVVADRLILALKNHHGLKLKLETLIRKLIRLLAHK